MACALSAVLAALVFAPTLLFQGCQRNRSTKPAEIAYVTAGQGNLRDRVSAVFNKVGIVRNGEAVEVLERSKRFVRVRTGRGEEGWIEEHSLVSKDVFERLQKLRTENASAPVQAQATIRAMLYMHVDPVRDADHLYLLKEGEKVEILKRASSEKRQARIAAFPKSTSNIVFEKANPDSQVPLAPALEDWFLIRDSQKRVGWALARMIDLGTPLEIAQYAEGQRIAAYFVLNQVQDGGKNIPQYLVLLTQPKDGMPFDFDQVRIFTWNLKRHRYETAYRERKLFGVFPAEVAQEDFGKEGKLPVFFVRVRSESGNTLERKYKLNGPVVRRVITEGEQRQSKAEHPAQSVGTAQKGRQR